MPEEPALSRLTRRELLRRAMAVTAVVALPAPLRGCGRAPAAVPMPADRRDVERLQAWTAAVRGEGLDDPAAPFGLAAARVGEAAVGTPYEAFTLEAYIRAGGDPSRTEPLTLSLTRFDCVSLVESCVAIARLAARPGKPTWSDFGREIERLRYRGGARNGYASRLHYFSEWIRDSAARGGVVDLGEELGGVQDHRPLRFMTRNRGSYPALSHDGVYAAIAAMERRLDGQPRWVVPTARIPAVSDRLETGDIVAFATSIEGLDVTHAAFAYRTPDGVLRVLHAPLTGGRVEVTRSTLHAYVAGIDRCTGILVARPRRVS